MIGKNVFLLLLMTIIVFSGCFEKRMENADRHIIQNEKLWVFVETDKEGRLKIVNMYDASGRSVSIRFSDLGIMGYEINDDESGYNAKTFFCKQYFLSGQPVMASADEMPPVYDSGMQVAEDAFLRVEKKGNFEFRYVIDYSQEPFFFVVPE